MLIYTLEKSAEGAQMRSLIRVLFIVSFTGVVFLAAVHIAALAGTTAPFKKSLRFVLPALVAVWVPTIIVITRLTRDFKQKDLWRAALRGCPASMRRAFWVIFGYCWLGFFILPALYGGTEDDANSARVMSAGLMTFYLIASAVSYSALYAERHDMLTRCQNGHAVQPLAKFCDECGAPVSSRTADSPS
jgi:hypothetical protein